MVFAGGARRTSIRDGQCGFVGRTQIAGESGSVGAVDAGGHDMRAGSQRPQRFAAARGSSNARAAVLLSPMIRVSAVRSRCR